ncbi:MAG: GYD domain-containing protein [Candidatus Bathyarchaeota archaeon]|nr:GYD domain-containing protein [Candidatus Bathyarchaeota archaeon]
MPIYLVQVAYTDKALAAILKNPENPHRGGIEAVRPAVEKLEGKILSAYLALGEYNVVAILQMPDNVNATALSMAIMAAGACKMINITPLLTMQEGLEAIRKAHEAAYRPPSSGSESLRRE